MNSDPAPPVTRRCASVRTVRFYAGELLFLAELVGLIVLERHRLSEPISEKVRGMDAQSLSNHNRASNWPAYKPANPVPLLRGHQIIVHRFPD